MARIIEFTPGEHSIETEVVNANTHQLHVNGNFVGVWNFGTKKYVNGRMEDFSAWDDPTGTPYASLALLIADLNSFFFDVAPSTLTASGLISSASIISNLNGGIDLVAAPGSNKIVVPKFVILEIIFNSIAYTVSNNVGIRYANSTTFQINNEWLKSTQNATYITCGNKAVETNTSFVNQALQLHDSAIPATGDSPVKFSVEYTEVDLSLIT